MTGTVDDRNMSSFMTELIWISASGWLFKKKSITMHGNMNVNFYEVVTTQREFFGKNGHLHLTKCIFHCNGPVLLFINIC
jgi:hypothetical protein